MADFGARWQETLSALDRAGRRRRLRTVVPLAAGRCRRDGRDLIDFSSNDYLGLASHPALIERAADFARQFGAGSRASRLVSGTVPPYAPLEAMIARDKGYEAALVFASGFQGNSGIFPALLDPKVLGAAPLVYADKLIHASVIHGVQAAGAPLIRFRHNDLNHLTRLLEREPDRSRPRFILTESVFSMDGDRADLAGLSALAADWNAFLYVDEAHATGVLGEGGFGLTKGLDPARTLVLGTFSKGLGSFGAYVTGSALLCDYLINRAPSLIYATALPPPVLGAMTAAWEMIPALEPERQHLSAHADRLRAACAAAGLDNGGSTTQIVPVITGSEQSALDLATALEEDQLLGIAIRPPTVPPGTSRIRFALCARHSEEDLDRLSDSLVRHARRLGIA